MTSAWLLLAELAVVAIFRRGFPAPLAGVGLWILLVLSTALFVAFAAREVVRFRRDEQVLRRHETTLLALAALTEPSLQEVAFDDLVRESAEGVRRVLEVDHVAIYLVPDSSSAPVFTAGATAGTGDGWRRIADTFAAEVALGQQPQSRSHQKQAHTAPGPDLDIAASPMIVVDRVIGVCLVGRPRGRPFDDPSLRLLKLVANHVAIRLERSRLDGLEQVSRHAAERAQGHVALLARSGGVLAGAIDEYQSGLEALAGVIVPAFGDWCAIHVSEDGLSPTRLVCRRVDHSGAGSGSMSVVGPGELMPEALPEFPGLADVWHDCLQTGRPGLATAAEDVPASCMVAPLIMGGLVMGAITFVTERARTPFNPSDLSVAVEVASRASAAIERVLLYREARRSADDSARMASHLRQLVDASLSMQHLRSRVQIASQAASAARAVLGGDEAVVTVPSGIQPAWAQARARRGRPVECEPVECEPVADHQPASGADGPVAVDFTGRDGSRGSIVVAAPVLSGADGHTLLVLLGQLVSAALDELSHYQQAVRRENQWRAVIEATPAAIVEVSLDQRVLFWNPSAARLFGWPTHDRVHQLEPDFSQAARAELRPLWALAAAAEATVEHEATLPVVHGEDRDLRISVAPLSADGTVYGSLMLATDVTESNRLRHTMARAEQMEAVGKLAGTVAHDFNNLLTVIGGYADMLRRRPQASAGEDELVDGIRGAVDRAAVLTQQLLAISRRQVSNPVVLDPTIALEAMGDVLERILGVDVRLTWRLDRAADHIRIDPAALEQLVLNLAINARDAMPEGGTLTIATDSVSVSETEALILRVPRGDFVRLQVADNGCGMDEATRSRCFEAFFTTKDRAKGTGLGLAAVQSIVTENGGVVEVHSELAHGSTFTVYLPRVAAVEEAEPSASPPARLRRGCEVVLVVEDNADVRRLLRRVLEREGYLVLEADGGKEAVRIAGDWEGPIELLVTDVVMPGMRGPEVAATVSAMRPSCKVLYISAYHEGIELEGVGVTTALLAKPFKPSELLTNVRALLDGGRQRLVQSDTRRHEPS